VEKELQFFSCGFFINPVDPVDPVVLFFSIFHLPRGDMDPRFIGWTANRWMAEKLGLAPRAPSFTVKAGIKGG